MTLGDDLVATTPALQAEAESMMVTPCVFRRPTSVGADPDTGADVVTYDPTPVYDGRCRVRHRQSQVAVQESASSAVVVQQYELHVPVAAGPFRIGDVAEIGERRFRVTGLHEQTFRTAQRLPAEVLA